MEFLRGIDKDYSGPKRSHLIEENLNSRLIISTTKRVILVLPTRASGFISDNLSILTDKLGGKTKGLASPLSKKKSRKELRQFIFNQKTTRQDLNK